MRDLAQVQGSCSLELGGRLGELRNTILDAVGFQRPKEESAGTLQFQISEGQKFEGRSRELTSDLGSQAIKQRDVSFG